MDCAAQSMDLHFTFRHLIHGYTKGTGGILDTCSFEVHTPYATVGELELATVVM